MKKTFPQKTKIPNLISESPYIIESLNNLKTWKTGLKSAVNENAAKFFFSYKIGDNKNNKLVITGNNWKRSLNFVPSNETNNWTQKINRNKFIKWISEKPKFHIRFGDIRIKAKKTIKKAWKKDWIWNAHSWQTKNIGFILEFFKLLELLTKIRGAWLIASQIGVQITNPNPK